jgi:hypothetical protein
MARCVVVSGVEGTVSFGGGWSEAVVVAVVAVACGEGVIAVGCVAELLLVFCFGEGVGKR